MGKTAAQLRLPLNLTATEEVQGILRLVLQLPPGTWMSVYFNGADPNKEGNRAVQLIRGENVNQGNVQSVLDYLSKENASNRLYVKNQRKKPAKLQRQQRAFLEERDSLLAKKSGACWGLDWETQIVGEGQLLPPRPMVVSVGDTVVVEVPQADDNGAYRYVSTIFMDGTSVLSKP